MKTDYFIKYTEFTEFDELVADLIPDYMNLISTDIGHGSFELNLPTRRLEVWNTRRPTLCNLYNCLQSTPNRQSLITELASIPVSNEILNEHLKAAQSFLRLPIDPIGLSLSIASAYFKITTLLNNVEEVFEPDSYRFNLEGWERSLESLESVGRRIAYTEIKYMKVADLADMYNNPNDLYYCTFSREASSSYIDSIVSDILHKGEKRCIFRAKNGYSFQYLLDYCVDHAHLSSNIGESIGITKNPDNPEESIFFWF